MKKIPLKNPTLDQQYCIDALAELFCGHHHLPKVYEWGVGVECCYHGDLSTHDFDRLTRMVLIAHSYAVRFELESAGLGGIRIIAHRRKHPTPGTRIDNCHEHPTLTDLAVRCGKMERAKTMDFQSVNKPQ